MLCVRPLGGDGPYEPTVVLDPMTVVFDETAAIDWFHPSRDGTLVAYGVSASGDERSTLRVLDLRTGETPARRDPPHAGGVGRLAA